MSIGCISKPEYREECKKLEETYPLRIILNLNYPAIPGSSTKAVCVEPQQADRFEDV